MRLNLFAASLLAVSLSPLHTVSAEYNIITVNKSQASLNVSVAGTVTAQKTVQLAAQMPGRIYAIAGREGEAFDKGAVLIQLDDAALLARMDAALAAREASIAAMRNAQAQAQREYESPRSSSTGTAPGGMGMPAMMDQMFTSPMQGFMGQQDTGVERYSDIINVQTQMAQANTAYRQAEANIRELQAALRDTRSIAPFPGVIEKVHVEVGDTVQPGQPIVNFSQSGQYKVEADLPVHLARNLVPGQPLLVKLDRVGNEVEAPIFRIHPVADAQRHTIRVELQLPNSVRVTAGQYAEILVPDNSVSQVAQLAIPSSSVVNRGGMSLVYAVDDGGAARLRVVRIGEPVGNNQVVVLSGIRDQDRIIDTPPPGLKAGTQVEQTAEAEAAPSQVAESE